MLYENEINQLKEEIEYMSYLRYVMFTFNKSFINSSNELILVPRRNAFFRLEGVTTKKELQRKLLSFFPYYIVSAEKEKHLNEYLYNLNTVLGTNFSFKDILLIESKFSEGSNEELAYTFIDSNFNLTLLKEGNKDDSPKIKDIDKSLYVLNFESDHYQYQTPIIGTNDKGKFFVHSYEPLDEARVNYNACSLSIIDSTGVSYDTLFDYGEQDLDYIEDIIVVMEALILAYQDMTLEDFIENVTTYIENKKKKEGY